MTGIDPGPLFRLHHFSVAVYSPLTPVLGDEVLPRHEFADEMLHVITPSLF